MNVEHYRYKRSKNYLDFEFYSDGPNGKIKKVVRFTPRNAGGITYFNIGFGDWNHVKRRIDDRAISNNRDRDKILGTVALMVLEFTEHFPDVWVYAQGNNSARTRLYQMGISKHWEAIEPLLQVFGYVNGQWRPFRKSVNYEAFIVRRK